MKHSKDGRVCFDPINHTYKLGDKYLQGVTGLIEKFKTPFDKEAVATKYATTNGLNKDIVLFEWEEKGRVSREAGTKVHQVIENYILTGKLPSEFEVPKEAVAVNFIIDMFQSGKLTPIETEMIVYNDHIASQIDCIAHTPDGRMVILDWKTNKSISTNGYGKFMKDPFGSYPDAAFYHYSLQLSLYKALCKEYPIDDAFIVHFNDDWYNIMAIENITIHEAIYKPSLI
jgi:ATP-dependent exoDNAse (exonuclease V) beta subunit